MRNEWIAAYYPSDLVEDQRTKSLFCLLYDKVIVHFPIAHTGCGGGAGISAEYSDDPLVEEGVLELREEFLLDDVEADFSPGHPWGTDEEFRRYHDLNATGMALICCEKENAIPATDKGNTPLPVSVLRSLDLTRAAGLQASALAIQSLELSLPPFAKLNSHDVLEARERLKDELLPFRAAMFALAPKLRSGIAAGASMDNLYREAQYVAETDVLPRLANLKRRLEIERGTFWRRVIQKVGSHLPGLALKWTSSSGIAAAVDAAKLAGGVAAQAVENEKLVRELLANGGLGYLVSAEKEFQRKQVKAER